MHIMTYILSNTTQFCLKNVVWFNGAKWDFNYKLSDITHINEAHQIIGKYENWLTTGAILLFITEFGVVAPTHTHTHKIYRN